MVSQSEGKGKREVIVFNFNDCFLGWKEQVGMILSCSGAIGKMTLLWVLNNEDFVSVITSVRTLQFCATCFGMFNSFIVVISMSRFSQIFHSY